MQKKLAFAFRSGLSWGVVLALCELGFGAVIFVLLSALGSPVKMIELDFLTPFVIVYATFVFVLIAVYFASGMMTAKWLAMIPMKSRDIAAMGALSGAVAEALRSLVAVPTNLFISYEFPIDPMNANAVVSALVNAAIRLVVMLPAFVVIAAIIAGASAYMFSLIFFRAEAST